MAHSRFTVTSSLLASAIAALASWPALGAPSPAPAAGTITLTFNNLNPTGSMDAARTWVTFGGATTGLVGTVNGGGGALVLGKSYRMSALSQGVTLSHFHSGRVYISYGAGLTVNAANQWSPNFANAGLADFSTRWDKVEIDWDGTAGGANLTAQDFFGIPLKVDASGGGQPGGTLNWRIATATAMNTLGALCAYSINTVSNPEGALVPGGYGVSLAGLPGQKIIRIINPATVTAGTGGSTGFPSFAAYVAALRNDGGAPIETVISGGNGTYGRGVQTYGFSAYVANAWAQVHGGVVRPGDLVFDGTAFNGVRNVPTAFVIRRANFTDTAIYGATAPYTMLRGSNVNSIVEKARADYLSALNFGFAGSTVTNPMRPSKKIGVSPSWTWYGNNPNGVDQAKMPICYAFAAAQPTNQYYNQFASYLTTVTDAYGFAFNDRLQAPLLSLGSGTTLAITVLTDAGGSSEEMSAPGPMDLVLQHAHTGDIEAWNVNNFEVTGDFSPMSAMPGERVIAVPDWNGDGQPDLITHTWQNGRMYLSNYYQGQRFNRGMFDVLGHGPAWRLVGAGDLDGDGNPDMTWLHRASGLSEVWLMDGLARTDLMTPTGQSWRSVGGEPAGIVDWNRDGVADLAVLDTEGDAIDIYRFATNRFIPMASVALPAQVNGANWRAVAFVDIDSDGDTDIVFQKRTTGAIRVVVIDALGDAERVVDLESPAIAAWEIRNAP